jgi:hypothetical protein
MKKNETPENEGSDKTYGTLPPTVPVREIDGNGSGTQRKDVIPDDEESIGKELFEEGMAGPTVTPMADDQRRK